MATAIVDIIARLIGTQTGSKTIQVQGQSAIASGSDYENVTFLVNGEALYTPPVNTTWVLFVPPVGNVNNIELRRTAGVAGPRLHKTQPSLIGVDSTFSPVIFFNDGPQLPGVTVAWI